MNLFSNVCTHVIIFKKSFLLKFINKVFEMTSIKLNFKTKFNYLIKWKALVGNFFKKKKITMTY